MLDAQCKMPKGSDKNFSMACCTQHDQHAHFSTLAKAHIKGLSGISDDEAFVIHHFAGDVCYTVAGFLAKNTDALSAQFEEKLKNSTSGFMARTRHLAKIGEIDDDEKSAYVRQI